MLRTVCLSLALALSGVATTSLAQDLRTDLADAGPPAEFPPAGFNGRQFVDSRGCVYVRAGAIGETSWVPRVTGNRRVLCGFMPTEFQRTARAEPPVIPDPAPAPTSTASATPRVLATPTPRSTASAPRTTATQTPRSVATTPSRAGSTEGLRPKPYRAARNVPATELAAEPVTPNARRSVATTPRRVATKPRAVVQPRIAAPSEVLELQPGDRIRVPSAPAVRTPPGYRNAWDDGRLNPDRGKQTFSGALQTALVWTQTVPRRLKTAGGRDVTDRYHYLVYPYTDYDKQRADLRGGKFVTIITDGQRQIVPRSALRTRADGKVVMSSKSAPATRSAAPAPSQPKAAGGRYVQVASFGNPANAQATARRLQAAGLPVRMQDVRRGGTAYRSVLAGPFNDRAALSRALGVARAQGFSDAFVR
ncbi:SPOR domain-containing protein [Palleronia pelagia]|uniref:Sporulation related domain-containing protein n=1 Tax=Palleronia pelagia TaxID=387096 RepID=A0A1H8K518_9RHOB|nr:SPOR domain-containing protein [Palleronia pelagia]SEN88053.1 Sporulation related domain-containing protein [Palleronia pelagia]